MYSAHYLMILICTFLWCKVGTKSKLPQTWLMYWTTEGGTQKYFEMNEERMQQEITRAIFLFTMHSTKQLSDGLTSPGSCKKLIMAKADAIQNLKSTPAAREIDEWDCLLLPSKTTVHSVFRVKNSRLPIQNILDKATAACSVRWN